MSLRHAFMRGGIGLVLIACMTAPLQAQRIPFSKRVFAEQVLRDFGQPVIPIYEGWYQNADGSYEICFGYFNLNLNEQVDIPLGERNFIEPAQYDGHQPTHFEVVPGMTDVSPFTSRFRRVFCAFTVTVPSTFGNDDQVWWTLQREGMEPVRTPGTINIAYILDEPTSKGRGDVAPHLRFSENGTPVQGRHGLTAPRMTARVGQPLEVNLWVDHPPTSRGGAPLSQESIWVAWFKYKGPGDVTITPAEQTLPMDDGHGMARITATFSEPGEYELLVQSLNGWPSLEFHCCWTNGYVPVTVTR